MSGTEFGKRRVASGIAGRLVSGRAGIERSRLSDIERGYVRPRPDELNRLERALNELIKAKGEVEKVAAEMGWPLR